MSKRTVYADGLPIFLMKTKRFLVWAKKHLLWIMLGLVLFLFAANFCLIFTGIGPNERGTFGDQFGAVNALFSGLAFTGLIYTIILQRRDLKLQRTDLRQQRKEMEEQTAEFEKQNETLRIQRFENTFFNMLSQFQEVVNNLNNRYKKHREDNEFSGREVFVDTFENAPIIVDIPNGGNDHSFFYGMRDTIKSFGLEGYVKADAPASFDHYFRLLYRILKFVKDTPLVTKFEDEYEYTSMLRAILSRYELIWLYYNGLSEYGIEKLKPLIERYAMLKNIREDMLVEGVDVGSYADSAYTKTVPMG